MSTEPEGAGVRFVSNDAGDGKIRETATGHPTSMAGAEHPLLDDHHAQFLIIVGDACLAASLAGLPVDLQLADGTQHTGVPSCLSPTEGDNEFDGTGYAPGFLIGGDPVRLDAVIACTVRTKPTSWPHPAVIN